MINAEIICEEQDHEEGEQKGSCRQHASSQPPSVLVLASLPLQAPCRRSVLR